MEQSPILQPHELETLRRSLAIGNGLPPEQIKRLLQTCDTLYAQASVSDTALQQELEALRPIIAELRTRLTNLHGLSTQRRRRRRPS